MENAIQKKVDKQNVRSGQIYGWGNNCIMKMAEVVQGHTYKPYSDYISSGSYTNHGGTCSSDNFSEATSEQIRHMEACIAAGHYVDCPKDSEVNNSYSIF